MCTISKLTPECTGSIVHLDVWAEALTGDRVAATIRASSSLRVIRVPLSGSRDLGQRMSVDHATNQKCGLVRLIAPGMICAADDHRIAWSQDDVIDIGNQVDLALAAINAIQRVGTVHRWVTRDVFLRR